MEPGLFRKLMDELPGSPAVSFTGGEPLLHQDIAAFIAYAKEKGRYTTLTTNGWILAKRAKTLCEAGLDLLAVSVEGPERTHDGIRGSKSFGRAVDGLQTILRLPNRPVVLIIMSISDLNYDKLVPAYELARKWGVDGININHLWMQPDGAVEAFNSQPSPFEADQVTWEIRPEAIDVERVADDLETIRRRSWGGRFVVIEAPYLSRDEIATWYQQPERPAKHVSIRCAWNRIKVWSDGKVIPCRDWQVGDINQTHVMEIWNGQEYRAFRRTLATHKILPICFRCCAIANL
jgi:MoaA/NifB/PqqE/SkfB family radical SAM enzyme